LDYKHILFSSPMVRFRSLFTLEQATMKKMDILDTIEYIIEQGDVFGRSPVRIERIKQIETLRKRKFVVYGEAFDKENNNWEKSIILTQKAKAYYNKHAGRRSRRIWLLMFFALLIQYVAFVIGL
jgi:hypothetical protein